MQKRVMKKNHPRFSPKIPIFLPKALFLIRLFVAALGIYFPPRD
jgi:hypothetical protein